MDLKKLRPVLISECMPGERSSLGSSLVFPDLLGMTELLMLLFSVVYWILFLGIWIEHLEGLQINLTTSFVSQSSYWDVS
jgi:hypothetical protein